MYGPGSPPSASKHRAVSSVTQAAFSSFAAAAHLAFATSCVVPCSSGTDCQHLKDSRVVKQLVRARSCSMVMLAPTLPGEHSYTQAGLGTRTTLAFSDSPSGDALVHSMPLPPAWRISRTSRSLLAFPVTKTARSAIHVP